MVVCDISSRSFMVACKKEQGKRWGKGEIVKVKKNETRLKTARRDKRTSQRERERREKERERMREKKRENERVRE